MVRRFIMLLCCSLWLLPAWGAEFRASIDRSQVKVHAPVLLTLSLINSDTRLRAQGVDPNVDLTLLADDFDVGRPEASTNYNIFRGQGRATSELTVEIFPKRSGRLTIPPFRVDGLTTESIQVRVLVPDAALPDEVFVRSGANLEGNELWAGQQLVVWLDLYHRVELESASLGSNFETAPTRIELLPHWKLPQDSREAQIDGLNYEVERSAWALFPNQAGPLSVELPDIWVTTQAGEKLRLPHQTLDFEVTPLPGDLPADIIVGKPQLTAPPRPQRLTQYELSDWTLTLKAPVAVTTLPRQLPGVELPPGLKLFTDPARYHTDKRHAGIMDAADYTLSIMPLAAGEFELPAIRVPYFDPQRGEADLVTLAGGSIEVIPNPLPQPEAALDAAAPAGAESPPLTGSETNYGWPLATVVVTLLWLATLWRLRRQTQPDQTVARPTPGTPALSTERRHPLQQELLKALGSRTLEQGLAQWRQRRPDDACVPQAIRAVQRLCYGHDTQSEPEAREQVRAAVALIRRTPAPNDRDCDDPWRPESFRRRP